MSLEHEISALGKQVATLLAQSASSQKTESDLAISIRDLWGKFNELDQNVQDQRAESVERFTLMKAHMEEVRQTPRQMWTGRSVWGGIGIAAASAGWYIAQASAAVPIP